MALKLACNSGSSQCLFDTSVIVHLFLDPEIDRKVPKGLESVIFCSGMRGVGKQDDFIAMWNKMNNSTDATFRSQAINALGCSDDPTALKDYLESILGAESSVSYTQAERRSVFSSVLNSKSGLDAIINFMIDFELDIIRSLGYTLENTLNIPARSIKTKAQQTTFVQFLRTLSTLDTNAFNRISTIVDNNLRLQEQSPNSEIIEIIRKLVAEEDSLRLPKTSAPSHYDIELTTNVHTGSRTLTGSVKIDIEIHENTDSITLHNRGLTILEWKLMDSEGEELSVTTRADTQKQFLIIEGLDSPLNLRVGEQYKIELTFRGQIGAGTSGFYRSSYSVNGVTRYCKKIIFCNLEVLLIVKN